LPVDRSPHRSPPSLPSSLPTPKKQTNACTGRMCSSSVQTELTVHCLILIHAPECACICSLTEWYQNTPFLSPFRLCRTASAYISLPPTSACGFGALQTLPYASWCWPVARWCAPLSMMRKKSKSASLTSKNDRIPRSGFGKRWSTVP